MSLSHASPDCIGTWRVHTIGDRGCWKCNCCGSIGYPSAANHEAAVQENAAGKTLERLTREGRKLLEGA